MAFFSWSRWLRSLSSARVKPIRKRLDRPRYNLQLEQLESRLSPATFTWTGGAAGSNSWTNAANWSDATNTAPTGSGTEDLVFPSTASQFNVDFTTAGANNPPIFNSLTFSGGNYTLNLARMVVGGPTQLGQTGQINLTGVSTALINGGVLTLGGAGSGQQTFTVGASSTLTIGSSIGNASGVGAGWIKTGTGLMTLSGNNTFTEGFTVSQGAVAITNNSALGNNSTTTVQQNAQLQLKSAGAIDDTLVISGVGTASNGALLNVSGNNTWLGSIQLAGDTTFGINGGTLLTVAGHISDLGSGHNFTKVGTGQLTFSNSNTYRGNTTVANGVLAIQNPNALGNSPTHSSTTTVLNSVNGTGTLQLDNENPSSFNGTSPGFVVTNENLVLNGPGAPSTGFPTTFGALDNFKGNNTWTGTITLGSNFNGSKPSIRVDAPGGTAADLLLSGVLVNDAGSFGFGFIKTGTGRLILTNANTFTGSVSVVQGFLNLEDSQAAGLASAPVPNAITVSPNFAAAPFFPTAALELQLQGDNIAGMITNPKSDSITGTVNRMTFSNALTINGYGVNNVGGALHSISGINIWSVGIALGGVLSGTGPGIGVDPDPHQSITNAYFTNDYGLTVTGVLSGSGLTKMDTGQLILPFANIYTNNTDIQAGWITVQNDQSLGNPNQSSQTQRQVTTIEAGASLHLKPFVLGNNLVLSNNFILAGSGVNHAFGLINQAGAIENLDGINTLTGIIQLGGIAGIGVEQIDPGIASQLFLTGAVQDTTPAPPGGGGITKLGSQRLVDLAPGTYTGPVDIVGGVLLDQNNTALGAGASSTTVEAASPTVQTISLTSSITRFTLTLGPDTTNPPIPYTGNATTDAAAIQTALNNLPSVGSIGGVITVIPVAGRPGTFQITYGGGLATFDENVTAAVTGGTGTITIATQHHGGGASLELGALVHSNAIDNYIPTLDATNGTAIGTQSGTGVSVWGEHLILNGTGNTTFNDLAPLVALSHSATTVAPQFDSYAFADADFLWYGPVTLNQSVPLEINPNSRLTIHGPIDDATNPTVSGSDLRLISGVPTANSGGGELNLLGSSSYRGTTFIDQGIVTIGTSAALGTAGTAPIQTVSLTGATAGTTMFQLTFNGATTTPITYTGNATTDAAAIQTALDKLDTIGGGGNLGGFFTVTSTGTATFQVVFGGNLFGFAQPAMTGAITAGSGSVGVNVVQPGAGGTVIAEGASLQLASSITVAGEPLLVQGGGNPSQPNTPTQWFAVGPAPVANGQTIGKNPTSGRVTGIVVDPRDPNIIYIGTAGGGAWKTIDGGKSWRPIFDSIPEIQQITDSLPAGSTYTLSFKGQATAPLAYNATAAAVQTALNGLSTIGGVGGSVTVSGTLNSEVQTITVTNVFAGTFTITFNGQTTPMLAGTSSAATVQAALNSLTSVRVGGGSVNVTLAVDPLTGNNVYTVTFTGTFANQAEPLMTAKGFNGTTASVAETIKGGSQLFTITFGGTLAGQALLQLVAVATPAAPTQLVVKTVEVGLDPNFAMYIGSLTMDTVSFGQGDNPPFTLYLGTGEVNNSTDSYYGTGVYFSKDGGQTWSVLYGNQVETVTVQGMAGQGSYTVSFKAPDATGTTVTDTTAPLTIGAGLAGDAASLQTALNAFSNIGGVGGTVNVTGLPAQEIQQFTVFGTSSNAKFVLNGDTQNALAWNAGAASVQSELDRLYGAGNTIVEAWPTNPNPAFQPGYTYTVLFTGGLNAYQQALIQLTSQGAIIIEPVTEIQEGGVDLLVEFNGTLGHSTQPLMTTNGGTGGAISSLVITTPANPGYRQGVSAIDASQGGGVVYMTTGDSAIGTDDIQGLSGFSAIPFFSTFTLTLTAPDTSQAVVTLTTAPITYLGENAMTAANIRNALLALANMGGVGGDVIVTPDPFIDGFDVEFEGALADTNVALMSISPSPPLSTFIEVVGVPTTVIDGASGFPGVWRFDGTTWFDLTNQTSAVRSSKLSGNSNDAVYGSGGTQPGFPYSPGPDDDYRISFPNYPEDAFYYPGAAMQQTIPTSSATVPAGVGGAGIPIQQFNETWSDVQQLPDALTGAPIVYASLGSPSGTPAPGNNAVFWAENASTASYTNPTIWYVGNPYNSSLALVPDIESAGEFPNSVAGKAVNGTIKFSGVESFPVNPPPNQPPFPDNNTGFKTIYAMVANPNGTLQGIYHTTDGGYTWGLIANNPPTSPLSADGFYASTILTTSTNNPGDTVYVGGTVNSVAAGTSQIFRTTNSGGTWADLSVLASNGPHNSQHAIALDGNNVLFGGDGGIWQLNTNTFTWADLNGNLNIGMTTSVAPMPTSTDGYIAGTQYNGTESFNNSQTWQMIDDTFGGTMGGGQVYVDQSNPNNVYATQTTVEGGAIVRRSQDGGITWTTILGYAPPIAGIESATVPFVLDPVNPQRLLVGSGSGIHLLPNGSVGPTQMLYESLDGGNTWQSRTPPLPVAVIGISEYQGNFTADATFPDVPDQGRNTYDKDTIYLSDGSQITVTKDHGITWTPVQIPGNPPPVGNRSIPAVTQGIQQLVVDPTNRDTVYAVVSVDSPPSGAPTGSPPNPFGSQLWESNDAAQSWYEVGTKLGLPAVPLRSLVVDPRNGSLYAGTDIGVYQLLGGTQQGKTKNTWQPFGVGMPQVEIRQLVLNQVDNSLVAATYGRGVYESFLNAAQTAQDTTILPSGAVAPAPITAPFVALSGAPVWTGSVTLSPTAGPIAVYGNDLVPNPVSTALFNIVGSISDQSAGSSATVVKLGSGALILSGANTYGGETDIQQGVIIANNPNALSGVRTLVEAGTALELESSITNKEPLFLNGDGPTAGFDGHFTGSLESIANVNTYTGPITLQTNATIGVLSGSTLTITGAIGDGGKAFTLTKEQLGTLILADSNTYTGSTYVDQGALQIQNSGALNASAGTFVLDGARIELSSPEGGPGVIVDEPLGLSGTGINSSGAMLNVSGNNTWRGDITLDANPGFSLITYPLGVVSFAVANLIDTLTITGQISDATSSTGLSSGVEIVGAGTVAFANSNSYQGSTYIQSGTLKMQDAKALGGYAGSPSPKVQNSIQRLTVYDPSYNPVTGNGTGKFSLTYNGNTTPLQTVGVSAVNLGNAIAALPGIGLGNVAVTRNLLTTPLAGSPLPIFTEFVYTIVFQGALAGIDISQLVVATTGSATAAMSTVADGALGALVEAGGALALDLANSPDGQTVNGVALQLNGNGPDGQGALRNVSGNATWEGPTIPLAPNIPPAIALSTSSTIGVDAGTSLTVKNVAGDTTGITGIDGSAIASLSKLGGGTLMLPTINHYAGTTQVQNGIINISNPNALGQPLSNNVQTVTINGSINGSFQLTFNGQTTKPIPADYTSGTTTLNTMRSQLQQLSTIGAGNVDVQQGTGANLNVFTVTFIGTLAGQEQNSLIATPTTGTTVAIAEQTPGALGYTIVSGGTSVTFQGALGGTAQALLTADGGALTGATPGISVATTTIGGNGTNAVQTIYFDGTVTGGTFTLTYDNGVTQQTTGQITWSSDPATLAANIQAALDGVSTVGAGNTLVTTPKPGTLQLQGGIAVTNEELLLSGSGYAGNGALESLSGANSWGPSTTVFPPNNVPPVSPIILTASATIGVTADAGATPGLTVSQLIEGPNPGTNLTKVGVGTLDFIDSVNGPLANTYTGTTFVNDGTVLLNRTAGTTVIPSDLVVGDGTGSASSAHVQLLQSNEIVSSSNVTVNSDGLFDLKDNSQTIASLTITDGTATTGANATGVLTTSGLTMTGGTLATGTAGSKVILNSDLSATSDAAGIAQITGTGTLDMNGVARTFDVTKGPAAGTDLDVAVPITGPALDKTNNGRLQLDANNSATLPGVTTVDGGTVVVSAGAKINDAVVNAATMLVNGTSGNVTVNSGGSLTVVGTAGNLTVNGTGAAQVDGTGGEVDLNGGTLSGNGLVAGIDNGSPGSVPSGKVSPGDNATATPTGVLTTTPTTPEKWGSATTLFVNLNSASAGPGAGYDQLIVNGSLNLGGNPTIVGSDNGGAVLNGLVGPGVNLGDSFTIIQTTGGGTISGVFQQPFSANTVFIGGQKFTVDYSDPTKVVLTRRINNVTITASAAPNPSVYGQDFIYTATLTPEPGAGAAFLSGDTVTFTFRDPNHNVITTVNRPVTNVSGGLGQATFDVNSFLPLAPGTYTVDAKFNGDANYAPATITGVPDTVKQSGTSITLSGSPSSPVYGQSVTITAVVKPTGQGSGTPTGSVTFVIDGGPSSGGSQQTIGMPSSANGTVSITLPNLSVNAHTFTATYSGDTNFGTSTTGSTLTITVAKDDATISLAANPSAAVPGQQVTFTATVATVAPGTAIPSGSVTFFDGTNTLGSTNLALVSGSYVATFQTSTLSQGAHTIKATYAGNAQIVSKSTTINYFVGQIVTDTALVSSLNPSVFGQSVTFTATVTNDPSMPSGLPTPNGQVTFVIDGGPSQGGSQQTVTLDSSGVGFIKINTLTGGTHHIVADYLGNSNFKPSNSTTLNQVVNYSSAAAISASPNPAVFGGQVTFTATVSPGAGTPNGSPTPTGTVVFNVDNGATVSNAINLSNGQTTFSLSNLGVGTHSVFFTYSGNSLYGTSTSSTLTETVQSASTVSITRTAGPATSFYSQPVTFTATVTATSPGGTNPPSGSVVFVVDGGPGNGGSQTAPQALVNGQVSFTFTSLNRGTHTITATYSGDAITAPGVSTTSQNQTVIADPTATTVTSSANPTLVGNPVTFTAKVNPTGGATGIPGGTVTFSIDNGVTQTTVGLDNTGQATFQVTGLVHGMHPVVVTYNGNGNFTGSTSATLNQNIVYATNTVVVAAQNPALTGVPVTLTATVSYTTGTGAVSGQVDFQDVTNPSSPVDLGKGTVNGATGQASIQATFTTLGNHQIIAVYLGDNNFASSTSPAITESVIGSSTTTLNLTGGHNPSVYTETLTYHVVVTPTVSGAPTPTGSVGLFEGSTQLATVNLPSGQNAVDIPLSSLTPGTHTIVAKYSGDSATGASTSASVSQTVNADATTTTITSDVATAVYSQVITLTAKVSHTGAASGTPTGAVNFIFDGGAFSQSVNLDSNGQAVFKISSLSLGSHTVQAAYGGSSNGGFTGSSANLAGGLTVTVDNSTTTVTSSANPGGLGQPVTLIANIAAAAPGIGTPTGSVNFIVDGGNANAANGGFEQVIALSGGQAQYTVTALAKGAHTVKVTYGGDSNFSGSSGTMTENINYATTLSLVSTLNPSVQGQQIGLQATVAYLQGTGVVTGNVNFYDETGGTVTSLGSAPINNGIATLQTSALPLGNRLIVASYLGDSNFAFSSNIMFQQVNVAPVAIYAVPPTQEADASFTIIALALDSNNIQTTYTAPAALSITSGPGVFVSGGSSVSAFFIGGKVKFSGLFFTTSGTYHLKVTSGSLSSQDIMLTV